MSNCPWCGMQQKASIATGVFWFCDSVHFADGRKEQSQTCRIRQLEAELAGVKGLLAACREYGRLDIETDAIIDRTRNLQKTDAEAKVWIAYSDAEDELRDYCREYAEAKEKADEPAK